MDTNYATSFNISTSFCGSFLQFLKKPEVNPLLHLTTWHFFEASLSQRLVRTNDIDKERDTQACLASRGWEKHHQTQSCSNLSWHARCLPVATSLRPYNSYISYNGSPCYIDNWIDRFVKSMTTLLKKRRKPFPHFYFNQCESRAKASLQRALS